MYVTNFKDVVMKATVNEVDLPRVQVGQKATVTLDAFPDKTFVGTVNRIDMIGTNSSGVVTFNVYISLLSPPEGIGSGMTASGVVQLDSRENVLTVPSSAVQAQNDQQVVRVLTTGNQVEERVVETGLETDTETEITSGLQAGETVITGTAGSLGGSTSSTGGSSTRGNSVFGGGGGGMRMMSVGGRPGG